MKTVLFLMVVGFSFSAMASTVDVSTAEQVEYWEPTHETGALVEFQGALELDRSISTETSYIVSFSENTAEVKLAKDL